jgi:hypothetical protein
MKARTLTSIEMINLFYAFYNPDNLKTQPITKQSLEALFKHDYV